MITNTADISLALAVWLVHDEYDHINEPNYISATSLMKPLRHIVLAPRVGAAAEPPDVSNFIARAMGNSLHTAIERAWTDNHERSLKLLGYPDEVISRIRINPTDQEMSGSNSLIPVYLEQRAFREFQGYTIGGKFDLVTDGVLQDTKSTSVFTWMHAERRDLEYQLQGSLYRWIDAVQGRQKITEDFIRINFIFTDWQKFQAKTNPNYPQHRVQYKEVPLLSLEQTEAWVKEKLSLIQKYKDIEEYLLPECTDAELWRSEAKFKFYADASKTTGRSTKNFDSMADARSFQVEKGGKGTIVEVPGEPKRCDYCPVFNVCTQKDRYFAP